MPDGARLPTSHCGFGREASSALNAFPPKYCCMNDPKLDAHEEAEYLLNVLCKGDRLAALNLMNGQFSLLQSRTQLLLGRATAVVTVTGIAGAHILLRDFVAGVMILCGLFTTLAASFTLLLGILNIRWNTHAGTEDFTLVLADLIERRDRKASRYRLSVILLALGL